MNMFHFENMNIRLIIKEQGRSMPDCRVPVLFFAAVYTEETADRRFCKHI